MRFRASETMQNKFDKGENMKVKNSDIITEIKDVGNFAGGLKVRSVNGALFYWSIEDWRGEQWFDISEDLYNLLIKEQSEI